MEVYQAINHVRWRLGLLNSGYKITWSVKDRAAMSALCIDAVEHLRALDGATECAKCGYLNKSNLCSKCGAEIPPRK